MKEEDIIISGRSIGSGPACHLAGTFNPACLCLISPIKSVKDVARQKYGRIVDLLMDERFNNFDTVKKVKCPSVIFHGIQDKMVPYQHSIEMLLQGFISCQAYMFLRDGMEHNKFDYTNDIIRPLRFFLKQSKIAYKLSKMDTTKIVRDAGYTDHRAIMLEKQFKIINHSQFFNNFSSSHIPELPKLKDNGSYADVEFKRPEPSKKESD